MKDFVKGLLAIGLVGASWGISAGIGYMTGIKLTGAIINKMENKKSNNDNTEELLNNVAKDIKHSYTNFD